MAIISDLDDAREAALTEYRFREVLAGPDGDLLRRLVLDLQGLTYTRGDQQGDVYRVDAAPTALVDLVVAEVTAVAGDVAGLAVTGRTGGAA